MLPNLEVDSGEGPSLEPLLCLFFAPTSVMLRSSNALLTAARRGAFSELAFSASSWIENCVGGRPRAAGDPVEAFADMVSLASRRLEMSSNGSTRTDPMLLGAVFNQYKVSKCKTFPKAEQRL